MDKTILLIVGKSGSGKSTIERILRDDCNMKPIASYTTRKPRFQGEKGHIFIKKEDVEKYRDQIAAYTRYNNNEYFSTIDQINESDIYVVDVRGVKELKRKYIGDRNLVVLAVKCPAWKRFIRMLKRGDSLLGALKRVIIDSWEFKGLNKMTDICARSVDDKKFLYKLDIKEKDVYRSDNSIPKQAILRRFKTLLSSSDTIPHQDNLRLLKRL